MGYWNHHRHRIGLLRCQEDTQFEPEPENRVRQVHTVGTGHNDKKISADNQQQKVGDGSVAATAPGGVLVINQGATPAQIGQIIQEVSKGLAAHFTEDAMELVEKRVEQFKSETIKEMFGPRGGRPEAFSDPDFQYTLGQAQTAFARSGDENLHDTLIGLIVERSKPEKHGRLTLVLNDAIAKAGVLAPVDFAALALVFYFKNVVHHGLVNLVGIADALNRHVGPIIDEVPTDDMSFRYMESVGVLNQENSILQMGSVIQILQGHYPYILYGGLTTEQVDDLIPNQSRIARRNYVVASPFDGQKFIFTLAQPAKVAAALAVFGADAAAIEQRYGQLCTENPLTEQQFKEGLGPMVPFLEKLLHIYDDGPARNATLTSAGMALAHANLKRKANFNADIKIWIK